MFIFEIKPENSTPSSAQKQMLIERVPMWGSVLIYFVYVVLVCLAVTVGFYGPPVWSSNSITAWSCTSDVSEFTAEHCYGSNIGHGDTWLGEITDLNKLNQELYLTLKLENKFADDNIGITKKLDFLISIEAKETEGHWDTIIDEEVHPRVLECEMGENVCQEITLVFQPYLSYNDYHFNITIDTPDPQDFIGDGTFTFTYVNEYFSIFELLFRFFFLVLSFFALMTLTIGLRKYLWSAWKTEQKWTAILLFGIMAFDNPLFPMEILVRGWFFTFLDQVFTISFICLLFFYFIALMDSIRLHAENVHKGIKRYHILKILLVFMIWVTCIALWGFIQFNDIRDPEYSSASDIPYFSMFYYLLLSLAALYIFYLIYISIRSCIAVHHGGHLQKRMAFFLVFTFILIVLAIVGLLLKFYISKETKTSIFLVYLAMFNLFTAMLAILYIPYGKERTALNADEFGENSTDIPLEEITENQFDETKDIGANLEDIVPLE